MVRELLAEELKEIDGCVEPFLHRYPVTRVPPNEDAGLNPRAERAKPPPGLGPSPQGFTLLADGFSLGRWDSGLLCSRQESRS